MIAQIQGLKYFVANHLSDVVDWPKHVRVDEKKTTGDHAFIDIATPFNRYRMAICSSYIEPPPGAPVACKSLGTVTFDDLADNKHIVGPKADLTWTDISKHIHVRELTDALAAARRELAEGTGTNAKLAEVAERAKKWGIAAKVPDQVVFDPKRGDRLLANDDATVTVHPGTPVVTAIVPGPAYFSQDPGASRDAPWLGAPILFITNPGEAIGGMQEIVGWCVKVYSHDRISIFMTPDHSEPSYRDNLPRRGSPAGNGRVHQFNCWDFNPHMMQEKKRIDELISIADRLTGIAETNHLEARIEEIFLSITRVCDRIEALEEAPKRRGRAAKADEPLPEAPKPEGSEAA